MGKKVKNNKMAKQAVMKAGVYSYRDRKVKKREKELFGKPISLLQ